MTIKELALELLQARREHKVAKYNGDEEAMREAAYNIDGIFDDAWTMNFAGSDVANEADRLEAEGY